MEVKIITKNSLNEEDIEFFTRMNKSTGHIPTGDTFLIGDEGGRRINYAIFTGKVMHNYWIDKGNTLETIDFMGDRVVIKKSDCKIVNA